MTYCGDSGASSLTMKNVPFHADVRAFGEAICGARGGEYGLACEHAHSCCILLARVDRFRRDGRSVGVVSHSALRCLSLQSSASVPRISLLPLSNGESLVPQSASSGGTRGSTMRSSSGSWKRAAETLPRR